MIEEATFHLENHISQSMEFAPTTRDTYKKNWGKLCGVDPKRGC